MDNQLIYIVGAVQLLGRYDIENNDPHFVSIKIIVDDALRANDISAWLVHNNEVFRNLLYSKAVCKAIEYEVAITNQHISVYLNSVDICNVGKIRAALNNHDSARLAQIFGTTRYIDYTRTRSLLNRAVCKFYMLIFWLILCVVLIICIFFDQKK